jgi:transposase, IS30 family
LVREIKRNETGPFYRPHSAHAEAVQRQTQSHRRFKRLRNPFLRGPVERMLKRGWSPEIVAGRLKRDHGQSIVSYETIYRWIYAEAPYLIGQLVRQHPKRFRRRRRWLGQWIPGRISIHERPAGAATRQEPGHWETDLVLGPGRAALQVAVERQTRLTRLTSIPAKTAQAAYQGLHRLLAPLPPSLRRSITYDNGSENALHQDLNRALGTQSYFCAPYHSWEKGTVEQTNGLIRRLLPKRTNFDTLSPRQIQAVEHWLNHRPRKCLQFQSPAQAYSALSVALQR